MKKFVTILAYTLLVGAVLFATTCESHVTITTPERDAKLIEAKAATIRSEADLRDVEQLARQYEIAYRHSINGATALYFKRLVEPVLIDAGERRDAIRREEESLESAQQSFRRALEDRERAWSMECGTLAEAKALIATNRAKIETLTAEKQAFVERKEVLAMEIIEQGYPESMLTELSKIEEQIILTERTIEDIAHENEIIALSRRLQFGEDVNTEEATEGCDCCEAPMPEVRITVEPLVEVEYDID